MMLHFMIMRLFTIVIAMGTTLQAGSNYSSSMSNIAKPGCPAKCGDVTVPYPFGIGKDTNCSLNDDFYLTCNMSSDSDKTPQLFFGSSETRIHNISESEVRIFNAVSYKCYDKDGSVSAASERDYGKVDESPTQHNPSIGNPYHNPYDKGIAYNPYIRSAPYMTRADFGSGYGFRISEKNMFTVIGCDDYGLIGGTMVGKSDIYSGCSGLCKEALDVPEGQCSGKGCCQTSITKGPYITTGVTIESYRNHTDVWSFNPCGYAFLGEKGSFKFNGVRNLSNASEVVERIESTVPVVLDWAIASKFGNVCKENSKRYDADDEGGYRCRCNPGYEGNPYLEPGCQDIDECHDPETYPCYGNCSNTRGSYECNCPPGSFGDAKRYKCRKLAAKRSSNFTIIFILGALLGTGILVAAIGMYKVVQKREDKKRRDKFFKRNGGLLLQQQTSNSEADAIDQRTRFFSARELEKATDQYNENRKLGQGGQGTVYKGMLPDGKIVAVKKSVSVDETQVETFINEVFLLSQISHRNVVKLLGCCLETEVPVLVYEFVSNGNLFQFIHDENYEFPTFWSIRITIATEVAGALAYMHTAASIPIYHRDIKSSNILLDEKFRAKLSDFGISKSVIGDQTHLSTLVKGTYGYMDPEYFQSSQFTEKSDVYSFGIVLVELLTGKKPIYSISGESKSLATLILSMEEGSILENIDDRVSDGPKEQFIAVAKLAKRCLNLNGCLRPTMKEVATELEGIRSSSP